MKLVNARDKVDYFALGFASPFSKNTSLDSCKEFCNSNCSCLGLFFQNSSGNCFLFDWIGSFKASENGDSGFVSYIKVATNGERGGDKGEDDGKRFPYIVIIVLVTIFIISVLIFVAFRILRRKKTVLDDDQDQEQSSDEDNFLDNLSGMPIRFTYKDLQSATNNFSVKLGQGGFGSVYEGSLPDGSRLAVKKLEGIGQGKKEFRAEVSIIGSIHHLHLVRLRGFCAEGAHRLLAYEFLAKGSLERWIFSRRDEDILLDWDTRFNIAVGTAKGLAYLHEDCDARIIHCDIKPENILLDDNFNAKVSDFGLAKLMTREQSHVFTTMRGTRGYLAPEWITNYAISEKSDVYSYGMVLLELIGGRKNYDPSESSEKCHFPSYAFKMMEEGKLLEIVDGKMKNFDVDDERVQRTMKTALWCIQEDMHLRPSMSKVVQMLEGVFPVVQPPSSSTLGSRLYSSFFKSISEEGGGTSSGPSDCNSENYISANQRPRIHPLKNHSRTNRNLTLYETSSFSVDVCFNGYLICSGTKSGEEDFTMDPESVIMVADGSEPALVNGGLTMESVGIEVNVFASGETLDATSEIQNENSGDSSTLDAIEHSKEVAAEGTQVENVDEPKCIKGQKAQRKLKNEKISGGKSVPSSVHIKKKKERNGADAKVAASNGSVAPSAHTTKSLKSTPLNGREAQVTEHGKQESAPAESATGDKVKAKPQKKQVHETSEDDTQSSSNSPQADDGKPGKVGALPNYGFSFKCDQRAEKRREFYVKLEEKTHAKEEEINNMQAKSKETQEAELRKLRKSLNFKATPMPSFYQEPQPPKTELKKIPPTRPKSPKLGRKKTDPEESQTPRLGRLSLDEKASKDNSASKGIVPTVDHKKQPLRKSLPRLPSQKTALPDGKPDATSAKVKPERKKPEKDAETSHLTEEEAHVTVSSSNANVEGSDEIVSSRMDEERAESIEVSEVVAVEH
ncbi:unnamed protein product [Brassica napus]|uniref:non-specific serine/threonine protein kinase n=1 Tax=Brassica napus TaxID=3708 RepID=A0A816IQA9_BRANA|nr:unnamed protein product [Brassica napus]